MQWFVIALDQGEYLEARGGFDWGRVGHWTAATQFDTREEAQAFADSRVPLSSFRGIEETEY